LSEGRKRKYSWNVWDPDSTLTGALGIDSIVDSFLEESARGEERKRQHDNELMDAMMLMRRNQIEDELREMRQRNDELRYRIRSNEYERRRQEIEEQGRTRLEQLERPKKAIAEFWNMMNDGIGLLTHTPPKFANAISFFKQASGHMANEIQFLVTDTQNYRMMMSDLRSLAETYSYLCQAILEFNSDGDFSSTLQRALGELQRAEGTMRGLHVSVRSMCDAFIAEGQRRDTMFRIAIDAVPEDADSGAVILVLMALTLNHKVKKYDRLIDELYRKLRM
jgi:hypothetical protein